jgi:hypothetical protein
VDDVTNRCFEYEPQTMQAKMSSQKETEAETRGCASGQYFFKVQGILDEAGVDSHSRRGQSAGHTRLSVSSDQMRPFTLLHEAHGRSSPRGFGTFLTAFTSHSSLAATSNLDYGNRVPTT